MIRKFSSILLTVILLFNCTLFVPTSKAHIIEDEVKTYLSINQIADSKNTTEKDKSNKKNIEAEKILVKEDSVGAKDFKEKDIDFDTKLEIPTVFEDELPKTLELMKTIDYVASSVTGLSDKQLDLNILNKEMAQYGKIKYDGMPYEEYKNAMNYSWEDLTEYDETIEKITIDITKTIDYSQYVEYLKLLSRYEGVYLYQIGKSTNGRNIYSVEIDIESDYEKKVILLNGQTHAREFAGGTYILKELVDLIQEAQTNKDTMNILKKTKYVAIPVLNVDGREMLIKEPQKWTSGGQIWKAYATGTDGNRNFPGLVWGQIAKGYSLDTTISSKPSGFNYQGKYGGSEPETKAAMKWLYHYIVIEKASALIDYHQQGSVIYSGKGFSLINQTRSSNQLRESIRTHLNNGNSRKYITAEDSYGYGLNGRGSTLTDHAVALALGAKFSPKYGFLVMTDGKTEYPLITFKDVDNIKFKYTPVNANFATATLEIGVGQSYLGNSENTRKLLKQEYQRYHYDTFLKKLSNIVK